MAAVVALTFVAAELPSPRLRRQLLSSNTSGAPIVAEVDRSAARMGADCSAHTVAN